MYGLSTDSNKIEKPTNSSKRETRKSQQIAPKGKQEKAKKSLFSLNKQEHKTVVHNKHPYRYRIKVKHHHLCFFLAATPRGWWTVEDNKRRKMLQTIQLWRVLIGREIWKKQKTPQLLVICISISVSPISPNVVWATYFVHFVRKSIRKAVKVSKCWSKFYCLTLRNTCTLDYLFTLWFEK